MIYYGLRVRGTDELLGIEIIQIGTEDEYEVQLTPRTEEKHLPYLVQDKELVLKVLDGVRWCNTNCDLPQLGKFKVKQLEIVVVEIKVNTTALYIPRKKC